MWFDLELYDHPTPARLVLPDDKFRFLCNEILKAKDSVIVMTAREIPHEFLTDYFRGVCYSRCPRSELFRVIRR